MFGKRDIIPRGTSPKTCRLAYLPKSLTEEGVGREDKWAGERARTAVMFAHDIWNAVSYGDVIERSHCHLLSFLHQKWLLTGLKNSQGKWHL